MNHVKKMVLVPYDKYQDLLKFKEASPENNRNDGTVTVDSSLFTPHPNELTPSDAPADLPNTDIPTQSTRTNKINIKKVPVPTFLPNTDVPSPSTHKNKRPSMKKVPPPPGRRHWREHWKKLYKDL